MTQNTATRRTLKIAVHNGVFHADDVFSIAAMRRIADVTVVRSRDPKSLAECDLRVDVGAEYAPDKGTFDHHQKGGAGMRDNGVPFAGLGLVWKHYGLEICNGDADVARLVEESLVQPVDAGDNGFALYGEEKVKGVMPYTISAAISAMNPSWQDQPQDFDAAFGRAVEFAAIVLVREIVGAQGVVLAKEVVRKAITETSDSRLVILDRFCPWQEVVVTEAPSALFVCFPSETGDWRIQAIPPTLGSFEQRRSLPAEWAGKRGADLAQLTGVSDAIFMHPGRFIGGAQSKTGILKLAELALAGK